MAIRYQSLGHIGIRVKDMEKAKEFYTTILELPVVFQYVDEQGVERAVFLKLPSGQFVELLLGDENYDGKNQKGQQSHYHCCLEIDARHEAYRDMDRKGVTCLRNEDDSVAFDGCWCSFITDPEGNEWEMMEFSPISKQIRHLPHNMNPKG